MSALEELEEKFPEILRLMPDEFDSHDFFLKLAHEYQNLYVRALIEYADNDQPFKIVHGQLAQRLLNFPKLVAKAGTRNSEDIFRQIESATVWKKVK